MTYKILHVFDHSLPLHSGYTFRSRALLREQHKRGWQTVHVTSSKQGALDVSEESADGLIFHRTRKGALAALPVLNQWDVVRGLTARIDQLIRAHQPDLVHAHSPALNGLAALRAARRHHVPVVYEVRAFWEDAAVDHGTTREGSLRYRLTRALETHVLKHAAQVTCICEGLRKDIQARGIAGEDITVIANAVDADRFSIIGARDSALEQSLDLAGKQVLGFLGSFYAYEGLDLLIDALALLRDRLPDLRLLLVGGGPQENNLKAQADARGVSDRVRFVSRVPHSEIDRYYSLVDVLTYPRHPMRLTELVTPLKPLEAMAQGRLVLASDVGGHHELIRDSDNGFLFRAGSADSLAQAIESVFAQRERWPDVLRRGRTYVENERTWARSVENYEHVYARALQRVTRKSSRS